MKIAIIGGTGLLGSNLVRSLSRTNDVRAFSRIRSKNVPDGLNTTIDFNYLESSLSRHFLSWKPDIIINTIAVVNIKECESSYSMAYYINCDIAVQLARVAASIDSYFIHISTDHFFNDELKVHSESASVTLLNNYARTKYDAEQSVLKENKFSLIVRTNIIGFRRRAARSFFEWLIFSLKAGEKVELFSNYYTSPISVGLIGNILVECYKARLIGIFNIGSSEVIDKYSFGLKVAEKFKFSTDQISSGIAANDGSLGFKRALTLGLDVTKVEYQLGRAMPNIDDTIENLYCDYKGN